MLNFVFKFEFFLNELIKLTLKIAAVVFDFKKKLVEFIEYCIENKRNEFDFFVSTVNSFVNTVNSYSI